MLQTQRGLGVIVLCSLTAIVSGTLLAFLSIPAPIHGQDVPAQEHVPAVTAIPQEPEYLTGVVVGILEEKPYETPESSGTLQNLKITITRGSLSGSDIEVENGNPAVSQSQLYDVGDRVIVSRSTGLDGSDVFYIIDTIRTGELLTLFVLFAVLATVVGSRKGLLSLLSMAITFLVIFVVVLPLLRNGTDPVLTAIFASFLIVPVTFYLSHGFEKKTTVSILGTFISLVLTGLLSVIFTNAAHLTGNSSEEALFLRTLVGTDYDMKGLLLAGIIIGTLGVMDDITVSQTSIVHQLHDLKENISFSELFKRSLKIGRDHIASMINTLVLVYTGASLPLLLLFMNNPRPFDEIINLEIISTEIVRTLTGSIGLILAVPITTYLACYFVKRSPTTVEQGRHHEKQLRI